MKRILFLSILLATSIAYSAIITDPIGDKTTGSTFTAAELNSLKNTIINEINGNLDSTNLKANSVDTSELVNDSVIPSKVDDTNTTPFTMRELDVTTGITASSMTATTMQTTSTGTLAVANITIIENSPTFSYGLLASTATITEVTATTITVTNALYSSSVTDYIFVPYAAFIVEGNTREYDMTNNDLRMGADSAACYFYAPIYFPDGALVTELFFAGNRNDALSELTLELIVADGVGSLDVMATVAITGTGGLQTEVDSSISNATVDNELYCYYLRAKIDYNDSAEDARLVSARVKFTKEKLD